jgi:transcription elongation factor GreA
MASYITKAGMQSLKALKDKLKIEEAQALDAIVVARGFGDFSENAELDSAKTWLVRVRERLVELDEMISSFIVFDKSTANSSKVGFACEVIIEDLDDEVKKTYRIVNEFEANLSENKISITSPIAQGLMGKQINDSVIIKTPKGDKEFSILKISYDWLEN